MSTLQKLRFVKQDHNDFFPVLRSRVDRYFKDKNISKNANWVMILKSISLFTLYLGPFALLLFWQPDIWLSLILWSIMGLGMAGIGMSVMHDANHGAYSKKQWVNQLLGYSLNLLGGSIFTWKLQHNVLHHTYTNVTHYDEDIDDKFLMKFSPHTQVKKVHRLQWVYSFLFYGLLTLYWLIGKDFVQFARYTREKVNKQNIKQNAWTLIRITVSKLFYFGWMFALPLFVFGLSFWPYFAGFMLMHFIAGLVLTTTFQLAHTVEGTDHPMPNKAGEIENEWAVHQLRTTVNFARKNPILTWYMGGLNYQVEHHLFPNISHIHYPKIADIVKQTAEEFGVPYMENKTLWDALTSHVQMLKKLGKLPDLHEAVG